MQQKLLIHGRVQGVGYRAWFSGQARQLGLRGWVRNRREGTVEAVVLGAEAVVERLVKACYAGPPAAQVTAVECLPWEEEVAEGFEVLPSA